MMVKVIPIDDGMNDPTLKASITVTADSGPSYHIGTDTSVVRILNNDRFPTVAASTFAPTTPMNTPLHLSFSDLVTDITAALAPGETNGTLQLDIGKVLSGHISVLRSGAGSPVPGGTHTVLNAGDVLIWTTPAHVTAVNLPAVTVFAKDGTQDTLTSTLVDVTIT